MKLLNLVQGSEAWKAARAKYFTASEASIMMACSKNVSRNELLAMKATGTEQEFSEWFERNILDKGHEVEALARPIAEEIIGEQLYPVTGVSDDDTLLASFDGLTMLEDICWECKQFNAEKAALVDQGVLPEVDQWQVIQQLVVSRADKCLYMVTDGTPENTHYLWVALQPGNEQQLVAGWNQFAADRENFSPETVKSEPVAKAQADLPALIVELVGEVRNSNLASYQDIVLERIRSVSTDLKTDQDFADADSTVKFFTKAEKELDAVKKQALGQTATIANLFSTVELLKEEMRTKRLELNRLVKAKKEEVRLNIITAAKQALAEHIASLNAQLAGHHLPVITADFATAIKGKKTITSLQSAADDELARAKVEANQVFSRVQANITALNELAADYMFLFQDAANLVQLDQGHMSAEVKARIADHKEAERKRQDAERERIRQEEAAKLKHEQEMVELKRQEAEAELQREQQAAQVVATPTPVIGPASAANEPAQVNIPAEPRFKMPTGRRQQTEEMISVSRKEYEQLQRDSRLLAALQAQGVDNWDGYDSALESLIDAA